VAVVAAARAVLKRDEPTDSPSAAPSTWGTRVPNRRRPCVVRGLAYAPPLHRHRDAGGSTECHVADSAQLL